MAMANWFTENWYYLTGIGGAALILAFYVYARRHPEGKVMSLWRRLHYTVASGIAVTMILMLGSAIVTVFAPELELIPFFLSQQVYWLLLPLYIAAWFAAPYLSQRFPISLFDRR
jgi:hypothetical protein